MPTQIVYANSDGQVWGQSPTYVTARSTATTASVANPIIVGQALLFGDYWCWEGFLSFDTSLVSNPIAVTLSLADSADISATDFTLEARLYDWGTSLTTGDYVAGASISQTLLASYTTVTGWGSTGVFRDFTDVAMVANLNLTGFTRMLLNSDRHRLGNTPSGDNESVKFYSAFQAGTSLDPKLVIDNDVGNPGGPGPVPDDDSVPPIFPSMLGNP